MQTDSQFNKHVYPKLSVIVPSYNQGEFLEETLLSIINQEYPNLELIIIDGGSIDNSVEVIKKYEKNITYWVSEKDRGQSHAINKGLQKADGEWVAWLNSDDCYLEGAFNYIFNEIKHKEYDFLHGNCFSGNTIANAVEYRHAKVHKKKLKDILKFFYHISYIIPSQSIFIRKSLIDKVGPLNEDMHYCMDLEWFCRIFIETSKRFFYSKTICFYRINENTKTSRHGQQMINEAINILYRYLPNLLIKEKNELLNTLFLYKVLTKLRKDKLKPSLILFFKIFCKIPKQAFRDIVFLGVVKHWGISKIFVNFYEK